MRWLKNIIDEIFGLFVDDGSFALAILAWSAVAWLVLPRLDVSRQWGSVIFFVGLAAILIESVSRRARS